MTTIEAQPQRLTLLPNPMFVGAATAARVDPGEQIGVTADPIGWLFGCIVDGFLHCACAHHAVSPDLVDCVEQRTKVRTEPQILA